MRALFQTLFLLVICTNMRSALSAPRGQETMRADAALGRRTGRTVNGATDTAVIDDLDRTTLLRIPSVILPSPIRMPFRSRWLPWR